MCQDVGIHFSATRGENNMKLSLSWDKAKEIHHAPLWEATTATPRCPRWKKLGTNHRRQRNIQGTKIVGGKKVLMNRKSSDSWAVRTRNYSIEGLDEGGSREEKAREKRQYQNKNTPTQYGISYTPFTFWIPQGKLSYGRGKRNTSLGSTSLLDPATFTYQKYLEPGTSTCGGLYCYPCSESSYGEDTED